MGITCVPSSHERTTTDKAKLTMSSYTVKFVRENAMLCRKQASIAISHPGSQAPSKAEAREKIAKELKVPDANSIVIVGMKTPFGGGKSKCLALAYDNVAAAKKYDKCYRLKRMGITVDFARPRNSRRGFKNLKTAGKKVRGAAKTAVMAAK